jgi:predicted ArsR family transcriptional regulator
MIDWWRETDTAILECLRRHGAMSPAALGRHLGMSEGEATAFLAMLVREGNVSIRLLELKTDSREITQGCPPR